ncbi:hypothetical protein MRS44_015441 [Fusarium solani]|uniref:uncharacterized protein n=1 Tax=Fusarium solani TaxID=169388 RepID=UPI0032C44DBF|nr:hypothetical protein MRS44_015441 [Fusarium solani]
MVIGEGGNMANDDVVDESRDKPTIGKSDLDLGSGQWGLAVKSPTDRLWFLSRDWMGDAWQYRDVSAKTCWGLSPLSILYNPVEHPLTEVPKV